MLVLELVDQLGVLFNRKMGIKVRKLSRDNDTTEQVYPVQFTPIQQRVGDNLYYQSRSSTVFELHGKRPENDQDDSWPLAEEDLSSVSFRLASVRHYQQRSARYQDCTCWLFLLLTLLGYDSQKRLSAHATTGILHCAGLHLGERFRRVGAQVRNQ